MAVQNIHGPCRLHLGCNTMRFAGFVNVDARQTSATDVVHDCRNLSVFRDECAELIFSHAFFEHLYHNDRPVLLRDVARTLVDGGHAYFCGLPDFEGVARKYLRCRDQEGESTSPLLDAYAATHGSPEGQPEWWMEQLHKSLFDVPMVKRLLASSGLGSFVLFRYAYGQQSDAINLGFVARKGAAPVTMTDVTGLVNMFARINQPHSVSILEKSIILGPS